MTINYLPYAKRTEDVERYKYFPTFAQCQKIIKLFISGIPLQEIVENTGVSREKTLQVLYVTREILRSEEGFRARDKDILAWS